MIVSINQPAYFPWLGYFDRIARSDVHIVLDDVQFEKNSFINRNRIATAKNPIWLTVPVRTKGRYGDLAISGLETAPNIHWRRKHWESIRFNYGRAPYFSEHASYFEQLYGREWPHLNDLVGEITRYLLNILGIGNKIMFSSEMGVTGRKQQLVLNLCKAVGANTYLSGPVGRSYLDEDDFNSAGIATTTTTTIPSIFSAIARSSLTWQPSICCSITAPRASQSCRGSRRRTYDANSPHYSRPP
jgi:hypothetical protein